MPDRRQQLLQQWLEQQALKCHALTMISGDASFRRYFRFVSDGQSYIAVDAPPEFENTRRFVAVAQSYQQHGVNVPAIFAQDYAQGFYLQEDLGDRLLADELTALNCQKLYQQALQILPSIQGCVASNLGALPQFDLALLQRECHLFSHWLCEVHLQLHLSQAEQLLLQQTFAYIEKIFFAQPQVGVHRDFHSRNLLIDGQDQLRVIDFQDAVVGPVTYDAVSLLRDCYQMWADDVVEGLLQQHWQQHHSQHPWATFKHWFDITGMQRHIKASGIFCRLYHRDGKKGYLADIPRTLQHLVNVALRYPQFNAFVDFIQQRVITVLNGRVDD